MAQVAATPRIGTFQPGRGHEAMAQADAIVIERPFRCTIGCFNRSIFRVKHNTLGYIGEVYNPWACLDHVVTVRAPTECPELTGPVAAQLKATPGYASGKPWYTIVGSVCQPAALCGMLPCGACKKYEFRIYAADDVAREKPVGEIARVWPGCLRSMFAGADADVFVISFPADANEFQKATLTAAVLSLDMLYFEKPPQRPQDNAISMAL
jgi:hypothetical protein